MSEDALYEDYCKRNSISTVEGIFDITKLIYTNRQCPDLSEKYKLIFNFLSESVLYSIFDYIYETSPSSILAFASTCRSLSIKVMKYVRSKHKIELRVDYPINTLLYNHQMMGVTWMKNIEKDYISSKGLTTDGINGGILSFKMGLGKTLTSLVHCLTSKKGEYPTLIVCSKTTMLEWKAEMIHHFGYYKNGKKEIVFPVLFYHKNMIKKNEYENITSNKLKKYEFVVTTYDVLVTEASKNGWLERALVRDICDRVVTYVRASGLTTVPKKGPSCLFTTEFERLITDESHAFSNPHTKTFRAVMSVLAKYSWCLTGTPFRNNALDVWSLYKFIGFAPSGYGREFSPKEWNIGMIEKYDLYKYMYSMSYKDANIQIPKKKVKEVKIELSEQEKEFYEIIENKSKHKFREYLEGRLDYACVFAMFTALRQCSIAPYLLTVTETNLAEQLNKLSPNILRWLKNKYSTSGVKSSKIKTILNILKSIPSNEKCLIFSSFVSCLNLLREAIGKDEKLKSIKTSKLDGTCTGKQREEELYRFRTNPKTRVMLISYKCGGEGLNLTQANHVICIEPWWTYAVEKQAVARSHRFGQTKEVTVYRINVNDSIESRMVRLISDEKKEIAKGILNNAKITVPKKLEAYDIGRAIGIYS